MVRNLVAVGMFLSVAAACGASQAERKGEETTLPADQVRYYRGPVTTTSPDGKTMYGPTKDSLVMRVVSPRTGRIHEQVRQDGKSFDTTLTQVGQSAQFNAEDAGHTFTGTLSFQGDAWAGNSWTYAIRLADGSGTITGTGQAGADFLRTDKIFSSPDGTPRARIQEDLRAITKDEYEKALAALPPPGATTP